VTRQETFADRLTALREAAGVSQYRLAQLSGVTKQTVSRLEAGQVQPSWDTVQALARGLGVEVGAFVTNAGPPQDVPVRSPGRPPKAVEAGPPAQPKKPRARPRKGT
jgi:transcriptional regulator with XRE-family HTH domain